MARVRGDESLEQVHLGLAWALVGRVVVHLIGVVIASRRDRANLVVAMGDARKRTRRNDAIA